MKKIISLMILFGLMISMLSSCNKESTKTYGKNTDPSNTNMFLIYEMDGDKYKYGYISFDGKFVIPPQYDSVSRFQKEFGSLATVRIKDKEGKIKKAGFINTLGKMVYKFEDVLSLSSYDLAGVKKNGKWGFIDSTGKFVIEPKFDSIDSFTKKQKAEGFTSAFSLLHQENHQQCWWFQKALAMPRLFIRAKRGTGILLLRKKSERHYRVLSRNTKWWMRS